MKVQGFSNDLRLLVYAYDRTEPEKQERAAELLEALTSAREGAVSAQVLSEFFVTVTRKLAVRCRWKMR